jgi:Tfp pilus assembly protein PilX
VLKLTRRLREDERGIALVTALLCSVVMLGIGLALLKIVDTQAKISTTERTHDRAFNLAESVLNSEAFVLGRNWPATVPSPNPVCSASNAGFSDTLGATTAASTATARLRPNLDASYTDAAYTGASWQVNVCDNTTGSSVWSSSVLNNNTWDENGDGNVWLYAQATVQAKTRVLVGLVNVRTLSPLPSKYGLVSGGLTDDLGASVNALSTNALGGVLSGLLGTTPTVAADPNIAVASPPTSGVTGLRCGATDVRLVPLSTCVAGTIGALGALPILNTLLGGKLEQFPTTTTIPSADIDQLRAQAVAAGTYVQSVAGAATSAGAPACAIPAAATSSSVVFIDQVGTGTGTGTTLGSGDQYCYVNVGGASGVRYKALVIGSGRVVIRGDGTSTGTPTNTAAGQKNTFSGVIYALNQQRLAVVDGGRGLGDSATPGREVVRIESGAHVRGGVYADGKSAKVSIIPPPITINTTTLIASLIPCEIPALNVCVLRGTITALGSVLGIVDDLISRLGLATVTTALLGQLNPQRATYGSAIVSDLTTVNAITVYGASGVTPGTFRDLQPR